MASPVKRAALGYQGTVALVLYTSADCAVRGVLSNQWPTLARQYFVSWLSLCKCYF